MSDQSEESLIDDLKSNTKEAVAEVVRRHAGDLYRAARSMGLAESDAEELVQATLTAFLEAVQRFEGRSTIRTYLFGILYRKALEHGRKKTRELATDPSDAVFDGRFNWWGHWTRPPSGPEKEADVREIADLIASCLETLPDSQRAAFSLREIDREPSESIRNILGVSDTHLRVLLFRARNRLRECIEGKWKGA